MPKNGYGYGSVVMPETNLEHELEPPSQFQSYEPTSVSSNNEESNSFFKIILKKSVSNFINDNKADFTEGYDQTSKWTKDYFKHSIGFKTNMVTFTLIETVKVTLNVLGHIICNDVGHYYKIL